MVGLLVKLEHGHQRALGKSEVAKSNNSDLTITMSGSPLT